MLIVCAVKTDGFVVGDLSLRRTKSPYYKHKIIHQNKMNILYKNFPDSVKDNCPKVLIKLIKNMGKEFNYTRIFESCHVGPVIAKIGSIPSGVNLFFCSASILLAMYIKRARCSHYQIVFLPASGCSPKIKLNYPSYIFLFLGYPQVNFANKLEELREYAANHPECWTNQHDDNSLISHLKEYAQLSREQQLKCQQAEIPYFDTSDNFIHV